MFRLQKPDKKENFKGVDQDWLICISKVSSHPSRSLSLGISFPWERQSLPGAQSPRCQHHKMQKIKTWLIHPDPGIFGSKCLDKETVS